MMTLQSIPTSTTFTRLSSFPSSSSSSSSVLRTATTKTKTTCVTRAHPNNKKQQQQYSTNNTNDEGKQLNKQPTPWALDLAILFNWEDIISENDHEMKKKSLNIFLDGANIAWHRGSKIRKKFKCRQFPLSAGIIEALNYEHWKQHTVKAYLPKEYVVGELPMICDGGGLGTVNTENVKYLGKGKWVNEKLKALVDEGRITLVERNEGGDDDLTIIKEAKAKDAWICSNDQFRDHKNDKRLPFSGGRSLREFARLRRFEHDFLIAPGLSEKIINQMQTSKQWEPKVGWAFDDKYREELETKKFKKKELLMKETAKGTEDDIFSTNNNTMRGRNDNAGALIGVKPYYAMPNDVLPCFFEPKPTIAMLEAKKLFEKRKSWVAPFQQHQTKEDDVIDNARTR